MKRKLIIEEEHGQYRVISSDFDVRSTTLDGALARAMERSRVPEDVPWGSQVDAAEVLDALMGRREGS